MDAIAGRDPIVLCDQAGNSFDCGISFAPDYSDELYMYVSRRQGSWRVDYVSTSVY